MRHQVVLRHGGAESMRLQDGAPPAPGPGQVRVDVALCGVAWSDVAMRAGDYPGGPAAPFTPGWDVLGAIDAMGAGVDPGLLGQRVAALVFQGGYASAALADARLAVPVPDGLAEPGAAAMALNYVTAWQILSRRAEAKAGQTVLVRGAAGGVGTAALDLARWLGLRAWGVASPAKRRTVEDFDAEWICAGAEDETARRTGGFDIILDPLGGPALWSAVRRLARGGIVITYGFSAVDPRGLRIRLATQLSAMRLRSLFPDGRRALFYRLSNSARQDPDLYREDLRMLLGLASEGRVSPLVADVLPLSAAAEAHRRLEDRAVSGKLLLDPRRSR